MLRTPKWFLVKKKKQKQKTGANMLCNFRKHSMFMNFFVIDSQYISSTYSQIQLLYVIL